MPRHQPIFKLSQILLLVIIFQSAHLQPDVSQWHQSCSWQPSSPVCVSLCWSGCCFQDLTDKMMPDIHKQLYQLGMLGKMIYIIIHPDAHWTRGRESDGVSLINIMASHVADVKDDNCLLSFKLTLCVASTSFIRKGTWCPLHFAFWGHYFLKLIIIHFIDVKMNTDNFVAFDI